MSDGDSIAGAVTDAVKDLGKDTLKQIIETPGSIVKGAGSQVLNTNTSEEEAKRKQQKADEFARIRAIEAEMAQIRAQNEQKQGPQPENKTQNQDVAGLKVKKTQAPRLDLATQIAVTKGETGRGHKG